MTVAIVVNPIGHGLQHLEQFVVVPHAAGWVLEQAVVFEFC